MSEQIALPPAMPPMEPMGPMEADWAAFEQQFAPEQPVEYLDSLPHQGFESESQRHGLIDEIVAVGLPVDNYRSLAYARNEHGRENVLGSWGIGEQNYGEFSIYELLNREVPERRIGTIVHESAHANTPLRRENAYLFGGERERAEAAEYTVALADQSLITGKYLDSYHAHLAHDFKAGKIDYPTFAEETQAIATELSLTNRAKLAQVEEAQHNKLHRLQRGGQLNADMPVVNLISQVGEDGQITVDGIDKQMISLLRDVSDYDGLIDHVAGLKEQFYPEGTLAVAQEREIGLWVNYLLAHPPVDIIHAITRERDDEDETRRHSASPRAVLQ